jgi:hypothetical protein
MQLTASNDHAYRLSDSIGDHVILTMIAGAIGKPDAARMAAHFDRRPDGLLPPAAIALWRYPKQPTGSHPHCSMTCSSANSQIPSDLVVRYQVIDIVEVIFALIWRGTIV